MECSDDLLKWNQIHKDLWKHMETQGLVSHNDCQTFIKFSIIIENLLRNNIIPSPQTVIQLMNLPLHGKKL